jgi:hypothetical protein
MTGEQEGASAGKTRPHPGRIAIESVESGSGRASMTWEVECSYVCQRVHLRLPDGGRLAGTVNADYLHLVDRQ